MSATDLRQRATLLRLLTGIAVWVLLLGANAGVARAQDLPVLGGLPFLTGHHTGAGSYQIEWNLPAALAGQTDPATIVSISGYPYRDAANVLAVRNSFTQSGRATMVLQELDPAGQPVAGQPAPVGFTVEVTNIASGVGQWRSRVEIVPGAPSRLTDLVAEAGSDDLVSVTLSAPAHATAGQVDLVRVECVRFDAVVATVDVVAGPGRAGINCGAEANIRIRGHNSAGWGSPSVLPEPARGLTVTPVSPTRAVADWQANGFEPTTLVAPQQVRVLPAGTMRAWLDSPHNANHRLQARRSNVDGQSRSRTAQWLVAPAAPTLAAVRALPGNAAEATLSPSDLNRETSELVTYEVFADGALVCAIAGRTDMATALLCSTGPLARLEGARFTALAHSIGGTSLSSPEMVLSLSAQSLPTASPAPASPPATEPSPAPQAGESTDPLPSGGPGVALTATSSKALITARITPAGTGKRPWRMWLQRRIDGKWQTVAQRTAKTATTSFKHQPSGVYRGWVPAQHGYPDGASGALEYRAAAVVAAVTVSGRTILMKLTASGPPGTKLGRLRYTVSRRSPWTGKFAVIGRYRSAKPMAGSSHNRIIVKGSGEFRISIANQGRFIGYRSADLAVS